MMAGFGALAVGANCEQEPCRMLPLLRRMSGAGVPLIAQPAAFRTAPETPCFTRMPQFPDDLETIQVSRREFREFAAAAVSEPIAYVGGCCGAGPAYIRAVASALPGRDEAK